MKTAAVIHPFLFAVSPLLFLFAHNRASFGGYGELAAPLLIALGVTGALFILLRAVLRDGNKAGIILSLFILLFFLYGHVYEFAYTRTVDLFPFTRHRYLLAAFTLLFGAAGFVLIKRKWDMSVLTRALNSAAIVLVLIPLTQLGVYELRPDASVTNDRRSLTSFSGDEVSSSPPDIYYIILDSYTSSDALRDEYGYDNTPFTNYLAEKGFYVVGNGTSNYDGTNLSLPSSLNMSYLHDLFGDRERVSFGELVAATRDNEVLRFLKSKGYTTVHLGHYHVPTQYNEHADRNIEVGRYGGVFSQLVIRTTALAPFVQDYFETGLRHDILEIFDMLAALAPQEGPKFVFAHVLAPHPPFVFGADGEAVAYEEAELREGGLSKKAYIDQLAFVNKKVRELVDALVERSQRPPIIILQADHGPGASQRVNFGILNAYYLPNSSYEELYPSITPVNSFRVVFNAYFNAGYELLPDRAYRVKGSEAGGYNTAAREDVTDEVKVR